MIILPTEVQAIIKNAIMAKISYNETLMKLVYHMLSLRKQFIEGVEPLTQLC